MSVKSSRWSIFSRTLTKTRKGLKSLFSFRRALDDALINEIEAELYRADMGPETVEALMNGPDGVRAAWKERRIADADQMREFVKSHLSDILKRRGSELQRPPLGPSDEDS